MNCVYIVAANPKEADDLVAEGFGCDTKAQAQELLENIHRTADPFYANQLKIYKRKDPFGESL